jgi:hypothetical protein
MRAISGKISVMLLTRFEVLALIPDQPEITGFGIEVSPSGRVSLREWTLDYETLVDALPEEFEARLAWHKNQRELGLLIHIKIGAAPPNQVRFYLRPDPVKVKQRYRVDPFRHKTRK